MTATEIAGVVTALVVPIGTALGLVWRTWEARGTLTINLLTEQIKAGEARGIAGEARATALATVIAQATAAQDAHTRAVSAQTVAIQAQTTAFEAHDARDTHWHEILEARMERVERSLTPIPPSAYPPPPIGVPR